MARIALAFIFAVFFGAAASAQTPFAPAVIVNDEPITYYDIEQRARILATGGMQPGPQLNGFALEQLIDDRLRVQAGDEIQITATNEELASAAIELAAQQGLDRAGLIERVKRGGATEAALSDLLTAQVVWRKVVNARFASRSLPSEVELDQEIELAAAGRSVSLRISEIAIVAGSRGDDAARQLADQVVARLAAGDDFAALARRYSEAATASKGGLVGWVPEAALPPDIAEGFTRIEPGQTTGAYAIPGGYSIFRLEDRRNETPDWAREAELSMVRVMVPLEQGAGEDDVEAAREEARRLGAASVCEGQEVISEEAATERLQNIRLIKLPGTVQDAVRMLGPRQASRPVRNEGSMDVFVVCDRKGGVDQEARNRIAARIQNERLNRFAEGYMQELRREAVIERR